MSAIFGQPENAIPSTRGIAPVGYNDDYNQWRLRQVELEEEARKFREQSNDGRSIPGLEAYTPRLAQEMLGSWQEYMTEARKDQPTMQDYSSQLAPAYDEFQWKMPEYNSVGYNSYGYTAPKYDGASTIDAVQDVSGVPDAVWEKALATREGRIRKGYEGQRQQLTDAVKGGRMSAAALNRMVQNLATGEEDSVGTARAEADLNRSNQAVTLAQGTQALNAQRSAQQATNTDAARQYAAQLEQWRQTQDASERKYATEYQQGEERFKTGLSQGLQEQQAAEHKAKWESDYGRSQDSVNLKMQADQFNANERARRAQELLSGNQAAQGMVAQAGTYDMNPSARERNDDYYGAVSRVGS